MAWLTTHNATNLVPSATRSWLEYITYWFGSTTSYKRTVDEEQYEYVGMTQAAAETCLAAMVAAGHSAHAQAENNGGGWKVIVVEVSNGAWAEV